MTIGHFIVRPLNADGTPLFPWAEEWGLKYGVRNYTDTAFLSFHTTLLDAAQAIRGLELASRPSITFSTHIEYRPDWRMGVGATRLVLFIDCWTGAARTPEELARVKNDPPPNP